MVVLQRDTPDIYPPCEQEKSLRNDARSAITHQLMSHWTYTDMAAWIGSVQTEVRAATIVSSTGIGS